MDICSLITDKFLKSPSRRLCFNSFLGRIGELRNVFDPSPNFGAKKSPSNKPTEEAKAKTAIYQIFMDLLKSSSGNKIHSLQLFYCDLQFLAERKSIRSILEYNQC